MGQCPSVHGQLLLFSEGFLRQPRQITKIIREIKLKDPLKIECGEDNKNFVVVENNPKKLTAESRNRIQNAP